jgi:Tfp pilus assembly protein PilX
MFAGPGKFAFRRRRRLRSDERGSMPVAMLVTMVAVSLSAGLATLMNSQTTDTRNESDRVAAISAAQAGLDAGLATIRQSLVSVASVVGDLTKLPCASVTATLSKQGISTTTAATYSTSFAYFLVNPSGKVNLLMPLGDLSNVTRLVKGTSLDTVMTDVGRTVSDISDTTKLASTLDNAIPCTVGSGVTQTPLYALLRSTAKVGNITRTLYATYSVRSTEETLDGGHIVVAGTGGLLCLGAQAADLAATTTPSPMYVYAVSCTGDQDADTFIYPKNLNLSLAKTRTNLNADQPYPYGLCITTPAVPKDGDAVTFSACKSTSTRLATQMFSYDVNAQTYYSAFLLTGIASLTTTPSSGSNFCLSVDDTTKALPQVILKSTSVYCGSAGRTGKAFVPDATVGAGGAGVGSGQFVNFAEVGRCLDLTSEKPDGSGFTSTQPVGLITYPCKQSFTGTPYWNHNWISPVLAIGVESVTGTVSTTPTNGAWINQKWCMKSPGATGGYVWVALCSTATVDLNWTIYGASTDVSKAYRVMDVYGNCLMAAGALGSAYKYSGWSYVITAKCDGSDAQKWNAPRNLKVSPLSGIQEK